MFSSLRLAVFKLIRRRGSSRCASSAFSSSGWSGAAPPVNGDGIINSDQKRHGKKEDYELNLDFSWVKRGPSGRPLPILYLTDHTKSPDEVFASLSEFDRQRLKDISDQLDIQTALGKSRVPDKSKMNSFDWLNLLACTSSGALGRKIFFVGTKQLSKESGVQKKADRGAANAAIEAAAPAEAFNSIHHRISKPENKAFYDLRMLHEYPYCPSLVFDMSFHDRMSTKGLGNLCDQLKVVFHTNRDNPEPFQLHFCNLRRGTQQYYWMNRHLRGEDDARSLEEAWLYEFTDKCYTDIFPPDRLIYLSPDAKQDFIQYDPGKVYVIGALVDLGGNEVGLTRSKAAGQKIRSMRLPRSVCNYSLTLNHCFEVLQTLRLTGDWAAVKACLPARKNRSPLDFKVVGESAIMR